MFWALAARLIRFVAFGLIVLLVVALPKRLVDKRYLPQIHSIKTAPKAEVAIVFGAGLRRNGQPTAVLHDRVLAAARLYQLGKVERVLMSGTRSSDWYDEPAAMRALAMELGVPEQAILTDGEGTRTFLTCLRAKQVFGIDQALLVSQSFHLPRALATCAGLGIEAQGVSADLRVYGERAQRFWEAREVPATAMALWETRLAPLVSGALRWLHQRVG